MTPATYEVPHFDNYQSLLKFVIHALNIHHHVSLESLSKHSGVPIGRLEEARKIRLDRKPLELSHSDHLKMVCTCFHLGADRLGLVLVRWGVSDWVTASTHAFDREEIKEKLHQSIKTLSDVKDRI